MRNNSEVPRLHSSMCPIQLCAGLTVSEPRSNHVTRRAGEMREDRWEREKERERERETEKENRNNEGGSKKESEDIESETWAFSQMFKRGEKTTVSPTFYLFTFPHNKKTYFNRTRRRRNDDDPYLLVGRCSVPVGCQIQAENPVIPLQKTRPSFSFRCQNNITISSLALTR
jgi:hypothetical protein